MPARAAYRLMTTSMYWRDQENNSVSGLALASSSRGDSSKRGSLSIRRACSVGRLFFNRLTDTLPSQMSRPRIANVSDTRSPCRRPTSRARWCSGLWLRATFNNLTSSSRLRYSISLQATLSVQCNYRHSYSTIVTYSNLWSIVLTGICLEVTLCHEGQDASDSPIREVGPDGQAADSLQGHRGPGGRIGQTCDRRLPGAEKSRDQERLNGIRVVLMMLRSGEAWTANSTRQNGTRKVCINKEETGGPQARTIVGVSGNG